MSTNKETIDWYNQHASDYTAHVRNPADAIFHSLYEKPAMYGLVPDLSGKTVVSLGCGSGEDSQRLKEVGATKSVGIDISKELVRIASADHPECEFAVMDMEKLSFSNETFDFAYSSLAIHYIEDWSRVFREVFRILRPNSFFLFSSGHPVSSAMEVIEHDADKLELQLSTKRNRKTDAFELHGNYLERKQQTSALGPNTGVTTWHKPLGEIFAEIKSSGFIVEDFVEPKPLPAMQTVAPLIFEQLHKIPEFMIFKLYKQ